MNSQNGLVALAGRVKEKGRSFLKSPKRVRILLVLGLIGMALILCSELFEGNPKPKNSASEASSMTQEEYVALLEERLVQLVSSIQGAGKVQVMLTLKTSAETIYVTEGTQNNDVTRNSEGDSVKQTETSKREQNVVMVQQSQNKEALVQIELAPQINGVVVVCAGAGNVLVEQRVLNAVTTVLGISTSKVCVVPLSE